MKTLAVFPEPDATATLTHDNGIRTEGVLSRADGRSARLFELDETKYVEGHGAWLDLKWPDETVLSQHGALKFKTRDDGRAAFEADVFPKPKSF